ncbi:RHS repeat-associated core domain-containing protein [Thalassomonas actiniarum]|uniref:RHS repeat protein n=1 Tax=Thalassomonas actiniarum TaxID=485447 RepID=A0AAE9YHW5_9GAMM|nr:RHS repeat-associated core domain-containing protein [Thalassomonas actiniarum]WDD96754.1 RHS repeat protein [Thalassomonas actiniarum]
MTIFHFHGFNRHIIILPKKDKPPAGFKLVACATQSNADALVREISPHLAQNLHALNHACGLLESIGTSASYTARTVAPKLSECLKQGLLRFYTEQEKPYLYSGEESLSGKENKAETSGGSEAGKVLSKSQGKSDENSLSSGNRTNHTDTEVSIEQQECRSDPVSMLTGEEILPLVDFQLNGVWPLSWRRLYRSSKTNVNVGLGYGWRHNFCLQLVEKYQAPPKVGPKKPGRYFLELTDEEGRVHVFDQVKRGQTSVQLSSGLSLYHQGDGKQVLIRPDDSHWTFVKGPDNKEHSPKAGESHGEWLLESISNCHGQEHALYYDEHQHLVRIACSPKRGLVLQYNQDNNLLRIAAYVLNEEGKQQLLPGFLASYQYDDNQALIAAIDDQGLVERYQYFDGHLLKRRIRPSGFCHYFQWQGQGIEAKCVKQWGDEGAYQYCFTYQDHPRGQLSTSTDSRGNVEHFVHDRRHLLVAHTDQRGFTTETDYDGAGRKVRQTDAAGNATLYRYNEQGQLSEVTSADGGKTRYFYNALGKRILTLDPLGQQHKRRFDATGRLLSQTGPDGRSIRYLYTASGLLKQKIDACGVISLYHWSDSGELLALQCGDELLRYSYDALGRVNASIDAQGLITEFSRDEKGQLIEQVSYDQAKGELKNRQKYRYDDAGRLIGKQLPDSVKSADIESVPGLLPVNETRFHYQGLDQPSQKTFADGSYLKYQYDGERNLTGISRSDGAHYQIEYSPSEKPVKLIGFDGREQHYEYDCNDKLIAINDSGERFIRRKRDNMGRMIEQSSFFADKTSTRPVNAGAKAQSGEAALGGSGQGNTHDFYQYDLLGRMIRAHNGQRTVQFSYEHTGPGTGQIKQVQQGPWSLDYGYNNKGQRASLTLPDGSTLLYEYDNNGLLSQLDYIAKVRDENLSPPQMLISRRYNPSGLLIRQQQGNGILLSQEFDVYSRLIGQHWQNTTGLNAPDAKTDQVFAFNEQHQYQYDELHQLIYSRQTGTLTPEGIEAGEQSSVDVLQEQVSEQSFRYNRLSQLIISTKEQQTCQYHWDAFGNPVAASQGKSDHINEAQAEATLASSPDSALDTQTIKVSKDRLLSFGGIDYGYDGSGNQVSSLAKGEKQQRFFDGLNQLRQINVNGTLTHYEYDALGRRSAKITGQGRTDFIWDHHQLLGEHHKGKFIWYIHQPGTFLPIALIQDGHLYYYHLDQLGTPVCLTDENGEVLWRENQDVFGAERHEERADEETNDKGNAASGKQGLARASNAAYPGAGSKPVSTINNPLRFLGQYYDRESGLHYSRFRYYCPRQRRFIHQDPIGLAGGINPYQYTPNPVNWVDPLGLKGLCEKGKARLKKLLAECVTSGTIEEALSDQLYDIAAEGKLTDEGELSVDIIQENLEKGDVDNLRKLVDSSREKPGGMPDFLKERFEAGNEFNRANRGRYPYNEVEVIDSKGKKFRVDSYDDVKAEIVSRKFSQLSKIKPETGISYLQELARKYPSGATISDSTFNSKVLRGQRLTGDLILEIPVQHHSIHTKVLDYANNNGILIRDVNGVIY